MADGGWSDRIQVLRETVYNDGGAGGEQVFGKTKEFSWQVEASTNVNYGLEGAGPAATHLVDGVFAVSGTHRWELTDGRELACIFGTVAASAGNYSLTVAGALPSYSVKAVDEFGDSKFIIIKGLKYTSVTITVERDAPVVFEGSWIAKTIENVATFTPTVATVEPLMYLDGFFDIAGTALGEVDNVSVTIERNAIGRRFIESTAANSRRLISKIIEGVLSVTFEGSVAAKRTVLTELWGGASMTDVRTSKAFALKFARGTTKLNILIANGRFVSGGRTLDKEADIALMDFGGVALSVSGTGSYAV